MSKRTARKNLINSALYRVARAEKLLGETLDVVRSAAADPGFGGPRVDAVEQVCHMVELLRSAVAEWKLNDAVRHPRVVGPFIRRDELRALLGLPRP